MESNHFQWISKLSVKQIEIQKHVSTLFQTLTKHQLLFGFLRCLLFWEPGSFPLSSSETNLLACVRSHS